MAALQLQWRHWLIDLPLNECGIVNFWTESDTHDKSILIQN